MSTSVSATTRRWRISCGASLIGLLATSIGSAASISPPCRSLDSGQTETIDCVHDWLYRQMQFWIRTFDERFAAAGQEVLAAPASTLRVDFETILLHQRDGDTLLGVTDLEATVHLPNIERRLRLFVTSEDLQESPTVPGAPSTGVRGGVRYELHPALTFDFGIRAHLLPSAFSTVKYAPTMELDEVRLSPLINLYADSRLGYGSSAALTLEHWRHRWIVRTTSYLDWLHSTSGASGVDWSQTILAGYAPQIFSEHQYGRVASGHDIARGAILRLYVAGDQRSGTAEREISLLAKRPVHGGWLFGYLEPQIHWTRTAAWHPDVGVGIGLDMLLGPPDAMLR